MKRTIISALIVSMVLTVCSCASQKTDSGEPDAASSAVSDVTASSGDENASSASENKEEYKTVHPDTKIKVFTYDVQYLSALSEKFKEIYEVPKKLPEGCPEEYKHDVFVPVIYGSPKEWGYELYKLIQSDDSPDVVIPSSSWMYYGIFYADKLTEEGNSGYDGILFNNVDGMFDFSDEIWNKTRSLIEWRQLYGKYYSVITGYSTPEMLFYKSSVMNEYGFEDPYELYKKGEWTWSKMLEMCRSFADPENGRWGIDGDIWQPIVNTLGAAEVGFENSKAVSYYDTPEYKKVADYLGIFSSSGDSLGRPYDGTETMDKRFIDSFKNDTTLFSNGYILSDYYAKIYKSLTDLSGTDDLNFVPYPRPDDETVKYQTASFTELLSCKGSKNTEGFKAFVYADLLFRDDDRCTAYKMPNDIPKHIRDRYCELLSLDDITPVPDYIFDIQGYLPGSFEGWYYAYSQLIYQGTDVIENNYHIDYINDFLKRLM